MSIEVKDYGVTSDGQQVKQYVLVNKQGMKAILLNYGAVITELHVPDGKDGFVDVVWGYDSIAGYEVNTPGLGSTIGRNANRIGKAQITINSKVFRKIMVKIIFTAEIPVITAVCGKALLRMTIRWNSLLRVRTGIRDSRGMQR